MPRELQGPRRPGSAGPAPASCVPPYSPVALLLAAAHSLQPMGRSSRCGPGTAEAESAAAQSPAEGRRWRGPSAWPQAWTQHGGHKCPPARHHRWLSAPGGHHCSQAPTAPLRPCWGPNPPHLRARVVAGKIQEAEGRGRAKSTVEMGLRAAIAARSRSGKPRGPPGLPSPARVSPKSFLSLEEDSGRRPRPHPLWHLA